MKNIIIYTILIISIIIFDYNIGNCAEKNVLFKDYYFNMNTHEAGKISTLFPSENESALYERFNTGTIKFANHYWDVELFFYKNKLKKVELKKKNNDDIIHTQVISEFNNNNISAKIILTHRSICDITKIVKNNGRDSAERCLTQSFSDIKEKKFFTKVYLDNDVYSSVFTQNKRKKMKDFIEIMNSYPEGKRVIVFNNMYNSYTIIFGTPSDALTALSAHAEIAHYMSKQKTF